MILLIRPNTVIAIATITDQTPIKESLATLVADGKTDILSALTRAASTMTSTSENIEFIFTLQKYLVVPNSKHGKVSCHSMSIRTMYAMSFRYC